MAGAGYTPAQIDHMTLFDVNRIYDRWRDFPPPNEASRYIAQALGVKFKSREEVRAAQQGPDESPGMFKANEAEIAHAKAEMARIMAAHGRSFPGALNAPVGAGAT